MPTPDELQPIVLVIEDAPAQAAIDRSNRAYTDYRDRAIRANQDIGGSWQRQAEMAEAAANRNRSTFERALSDVERIAKAGGGAAESVIKAVTKIGAAGLEAVGVFKLVQAAIQNTSAEAPALERAFEGVRNSVRAVEIGAAGIRAGIGAAIDVAGIIAAAHAVELIAENAYSRAAQLQAQSIQSAKSNIAYPDVVSLNFAAQRAGVAPDFFDQASRASGGVDVLANRLKELGEVRDPIERTRLAFAEFGDQAEKLLPELGDRFGENISRAREWGLALDQIDRQNIDTFRRDIDSLKQSLVGLSDELAARSQGIGTYFAQAFGAFYTNLKEIATLAPAALQVATGAIAKVTGVPQIAFTTEPFDVAAASQHARESAGITVQQSSESLLFQDAQRLVPAATAQFLKSRGDQEDALRARVTELQKKLFVSDITSPQYGQPVPGAQFIGGYPKEAEALQEYVSKSGRIQQLEAEKQAQKDLEAAQKIVGAQLQAAQLSELSGPDRLRAQQASELRDQGLNPQLIQQINERFSILFRDEGQKEIDESHAALVNRAQVEAQQQADLLRGRTQYTVGAFSETQQLREQGGQREGELELQQAAAQRSSQLLALESQTAQLPQSADRRTSREYENQVLAQKLSIEQQKVGIEQTYFEKARDLELAGLQAGYDKQLVAARVLADSKLITEQAFNERQMALESNLEAERKAIALRTDTEINDSRVRAAIEANKLIQEHNEELARQLQQQFDAIAKPAENLFHTLFTNSKAFGAQLRETLRDAALKPIEEGLGNLTASFLHPVIFGPNGQGGIAGGLNGLFGGRPQDPVAIATDANTRVTSANTTAILALNAALNSPGNSAPPQLQNAVPQSTNTRQLSEAIVSALPHFADGGIISGPTVGLLGEAGTEAVVPMSGDWLQNLERVIGYKGQGQWQTGQFSEGQGIVGAAEAIAQSPAGRIGELFGARAIVNRISEPQVHEAERLVKQIYHRSIDRKEAQHIVDIANTKFQHHVSVAVRSPEVRESLGYFQPPPQQHFQDGGLVQQTGPAIVHQGEAVLPAELTALLTGAASAVHGAQSTVADGFVRAMSELTGAVNRLTGALSRSPVAAPAPPGLEPRNLSTRVGGFPINVEPTDLTADGAYGDYDQATNSINLYRQGLERPNANSNIAQVIQHETVHGLLRNRSSGQVQDLTGILGNDFVDQASAGIEDRYGYPAADAVNEVIPRLVSGESLDAMGINAAQRQALLAQLNAGLRARGDSTLAQQLEQLSSAKGLPDLVTTGRQHDYAPLPASFTTAYSDTAPLSFFGGNAPPSLPVSLPPNTAALSFFGDQTEAVPYSPSPSDTYSQLQPPTGQPATGIPSGYSGPKQPSAFSQVLGAIGGGIKGGPGGILQQVLGGGGTPGGGLGSFGIPGAPGGTSGFSGPVGGFGGRSQSSIPSIIQNFQQGGLRSVFLGPQAAANTQAPISFFGQGSDSAPISFFGGNGAPEASDTAPLSFFGDSSDTAPISFFGDSGGPAAGSTAAAALSGPLGGLAGAGLGTAGSFLLQQGLFGSNEGTIGGAFEAAGGGAALGFQYGGPIGAAIGAGVGLAVGIGETIAGVQPQYKEAEDLVKKLYNITIEQSTGQQIADLANQKYGGHVSEAVRDPQIRQMLELYSAATGQLKNSVLSSTTPHGASLVEQGGDLYQAPTYLYGNPYTFASNLPTLGGIPTGTYPNPVGAPPVQASVSSAAPSVASAPVAGSSPAPGSASNASDSSSAAFTHATFVFNGQSVGDAIDGRVAEVADSSYISDNLNDALNGSNGRTQTSALLTQSGLIIS